MYAAGGDDKTYSLLENVFAFASSAMIPIGTAGKAGELTFRSGIVMLGKEGASTLAGYGASNLVYDKTNNQTLGMIAGILASMGSAKGLNMADAKLGWSNKGVKGNVVESVTGDIESGSTSNYYNPDGSPIWPPNRGFDGNPTKVTLEPGTLIDRYGYDGGTFVSPKGIPYTERSLPIGTDQKPYTVFEVVKPVEVQAGKIAPWFGEKGGGIQYEFSQKISDLLQQGILRKVQN